MQREPFHISRDRGELSECCTVSVENNAETSVACDQILQPCDVQTPNTKNRRRTPHRSMSYDI